MASQTEAVAQSVVDTAPPWQPASARTLLRAPVRKGRALFNSVPPCGTSPTSSSCPRASLVRKDAFAVEKRLAHLGASKWGARPAQRAESLARWPVDN